MRVLRAIFVGALLVVFTATPSLACMKAFSQMSEAEMACCKKMAMDCGAMKNSDHPCCQQQTVSPIGAAQVSLAQTQTLLIAVAVSAPALSVSTSDLQQSYEVHRQSHSPPIPNGSSLVLRI